MENGLKEFHSEDVFDQEMLNIETVTGINQVDTDDIQFVSNKVQSKCNIPYTSIQAPVISGKGAIININYNFFGAPKKNWG